LNKDEPLNKDEAALLDAMDTAAALFDGAGHLQMVAWLCFTRRHEAGLLDGLARLQSALIKSIDMHESGHAHGGPQRATDEDVACLQRLIALVTQWRTGGEFSQEIEPLARRLFVAIGGNVSDLPAEGEAEGPEQTHP
jgi:hypothetical protein